MCHFADTASGETVMVALCWRKGAMRGAVVEVARWRRVRGQEGVVAPMMRPSEATSDRRCLVVSAQPYDQKPYMAPVRREVPAVVGRIIVDSEVRARGGR